MADDIRRRILRAAETAFLEHGRDAAIRDIFTRAGVSSGSCYHLFRTKHALTEALAEAILAGRHERVLAAIAAPGAVGQAAMTAAVAAYLRWAAEEPGQVRLLSLLPSSGPSPADGGAADRGIQREIGTVAIWAAPSIESGAIEALPAAVLHALIFGPAGQMIRGGPGDASAGNLLAIAPLLAAAAWNAIVAGPSDTAAVRRRAAADRVPRRGKTRAEQSQPAGTLL